MSCSRLRPSRPSGTQSSGPPVHAACTYPFTCGRLSLREKTDNSPSLLRESTTAELSVSSQPALLHWDLNQFTAKSRHRFLPAVRETSCAAGLRQGPSAHLQRSAGETVLHAHTGRSGRHQGSLTPYPAPTRSGPSRHFSNLPASAWERPARGLHRVRARAHGCT